MKAHKHAEIEEISFQTSLSNEMKGKEINALELADAMEIRASIRRKATNRQENEKDRLADQLDQAATILRQQHAEIESLKFRDLTDEEIFEVSDKFPFLEYGHDRYEFAKAILKKANEK